MEREPEDVEPRSPLLDWLDEDLTPEPEPDYDEASEQNIAPIAPQELKIDPDVVARIRVRYDEPTEQSEEELPSGPTCKYFAPAESLLDTMGAEPGTGWPYDTLFGTHGCCHPGRNRNGRLSCDAYMCMPACYYYEEEAASLIQGKQSNDVKVLLRKRRVGLGIPTYDVVKAQEGSEELLASFDNHTEQGNAQAKATQSYDKEIETRNLADATDLEPETYEIPSYLKMLVAEHA